MLRTSFRPQHSPRLLPIVSTGFADRAGRFFGALAQKNQFRVSKKMLRTRIRPEHSPRPLLLSIVSTGSAGRAGRFFGASAQKNQFRVSKTRAGREFVRLESPHGRFLALFHHAHEELHRAARRVQTDVLVVAVDRVPLFRRQIHRGEAVDAVAQVAVMAAV